jgi:signal transduction histidine kinase
MIKREYSDEIKNYRTRLAEALWENLKLKSLVKNHKTLREMIAHDAKGPIAGILQIVELLKEEGENLSKETIQEFYGYLEASSKKAINIMESIKLCDLTKKEIEKEKKEFYFEEIALNNAHSLSEKFKNAGVRVDFKYNEYNEKIRSNPNLLEMLYSNLIGDGLNNAPEGTVVKSGIKRTNNKDLEIIIENKTTGKKQRTVEGLGKGYGSKNIKTILNLLDGKMEIYDYSIINKDYDILHKFGNKVINKEDNNYRTYAKRITIPKSEINILNEDKI